MKAINSCNFRCVLACAIIAGLWAAISTKADVGGGGKRQTPYDEPGNVSEEAVMRVKAVSARRRGATIPIEGRDFPSVMNLAIVVAKDGKISSDSVYRFEGKDENGKIASVDFSDVKAFKVLRIEKKKCLLEIITFPTITPKDLLANRPSYSELVNSYASSVNLWVQVETPNGEVSIAGEDWDGNRKFVATMRDVKPNSTISLKYGRSKEVGGTGDAIWFATKSVIEDPAYPYKLVFKS